MSNLFAHIITMLGVLNNIIEDLGQRRNLYTGFPEKAGLLQDLLKKSAISVIALLDYLS